MTKQLSFTKYEREVLPQLRESLNKAESTEDIKKFFVYAAVKLLDQIFSLRDVKVLYEDIVFEPETAPFYRIADRLRSQEMFSTTWNTSDIHLLIANMAKTAQKHHIRLEKHFAKTEAKIRRQQ